MSGELLVAVQTLADELCEIHPEVQVGHSREAIHLYTADPEWFQKSSLWGYFEHGFQGYRVQVKPTRASRLISA